MEQNAARSVAHNHAGWCFVEGFVCFVEGFCLAGPENGARDLRKPQACGLNVSACRGFAKSVMKKSN